MLRDTLGIQLVPKGEGYHRVSPAEVNYPQNGEELHFPAGGQLVCMLDFLMNGVITLSVSCILDHPAPSWRCLWMRIMVPLLGSPKSCSCNVTHWRTLSGLSNFLSESMAFIFFWVWECCLETRKVKSLDPLHTYPSSTTTTIVIIIGVETAYWEHSLNYIYCLS